MNVLLVSASLHGLGGVETVVRNLASGLGESGHRVMLLGLGEGAEDGTEGTGRYETRILHSRATGRYSAREGKGALYRAWWGGRCLHNPALLDEVREVVRGFGPDVVHSHKVRGFPGGLWARLRESAGCPLVHSCHDIELLSPMHQLEVTSRSAFAAGLLGLWQLAGRRSSGLVDAVTAPSEFLLGLHRNAGFFARARAEVVGNFADFAEDDRFGALSDPDPAEPLRLLYVGRLVKSKGIVDLCAAVARAAERGARFELRVAGDGPCINQVRGFAARQGSTHYEGVAHGRRKAKLFEWAQVVVTPSRCDEAFCMVAAEAIAASRPVLASSRGALPEVVRDGLTGWIYAGEGEDALAAGLRRVLGDRHRLPELSRNCAERAGAFQRGYAVRRYEDIYRSLR